MRDNGLHDKTARLVYTIKMRDNGLHDKTARLVYTIKLRDSGLQINNVTLLPDTTSSSPILPLHKGYVTAVMVFLGHVTEAYERV
jgi:hypothetical protein